MNEEGDNNSAIRQMVCSKAEEAKKIEPDDSEPVRRISRPEDNENEPRDEHHHHHHQEQKQSPQFFLSEGNREFIHKRVTSAIQAYSHGLERLEEEDAAEAQPKISNKERERCKEKRGKTPNNCSVSLDLLSARALAYLSIGNYAAALEDTGKVLQSKPRHFKGALRQAKGLAGLARFLEAINCVEDLLKKDKSSSGGDKLAKEEVKELSSYCESLKWMRHQSETGELYDVPPIMDKPFEPAPSDWVDYIGPISVEEVEGRGRGLVAVDDLPKSKLILACRAFEIIFLDGTTRSVDELSEESDKALNNGGFKLEKDDITLNLLARKIYDRLGRNPERRPEFYQLHAGNELGHLKSPPESEETPPPPLDMARIYGICRTNTFANSGDSYPEVEKSVGLWLYPAYVNHQCIGGNCTWKIFGDFIFIRTFKPIKKGEELIVSYVSPAYSLLQRTNVLTQRLGFVCNCKLCEMDRELAPSVHDEKMKLKQLALNMEVKFSQLEIPQESEDHRKKVESSIVLLEQIVSKLEKIQPHHGQYNASLLDPLQKLGLKYFGVGQLQKTTAVMERACSLMKSCMLPHAIADCSMWIIAAYLHMGNNKQAKKWGRVLKENLEMAYGDVQALRLLGPWMLEPMTQWGFV